MSPGRGSPWLRWARVEAAMTLVRNDVKLASFDQRIRRRSGTKSARFPAVRKLAEICWKTAAALAPVECDGHGTGMTRRTLCDV